MQGIEDAAKRREPVIIHGVVSPDASSGDGDKAGLAQDFEVMADRRLGDVEAGSDIADADRIVLSRNESKDLQACGITERVEDRDELGPRTVRQSVDGGGRGTTINRA